MKFEGTVAQVAAQEATVASLAKKYGGVSGGAENGRAGYNVTMAIAYIADFVGEHGEPWRGSHSPAVGSFSFGVLYMKWSGLPEDGVLVNGAVAPKTIESGRRQHRRRVTRVHVPRNQASSARHSRPAAAGTSSTCAHFLLQ
jgi:hypothetical protein